MRLGLIADIHGNLVALQSVLAELEEAGVDRLVCLGDVCVLGPQPAECLRLLQEMGCPVVLGNTDDWLVTGLRFASGEPDPMTTALVEWTASKLTGDDMSVLRAYQRALRLAGDGWAVQCFHGSPLSYNDVIGVGTPDEDVARMLGVDETTIWAGGHTHVQMVRRFRNGHIVNPGSVGLPGVGPGTPGLLVNTDIAWAEYGILTLGDGRIGIELRRTPLDVAAMVEAAQASGMPHVDWWSGLYRS